MDADIKYLTPELKSLYMEDFNKNVVPCSDEYWALDNGLKDILININKNKNIQTLYSKKWQGYENDATSFLYFAFTKKVDEGEINHFFEQCEKKYDLIFHYDSPNVWDAKYTDHNEQVKILSCIVNKNHFNIGKFAITMYSCELIDHDNFWNDLNKFLSTI